MTVDERLANRWRRQQEARCRQANERGLLNRQSRLAAMSLAFRRAEGGSSLANVDSRLKPLWQRARMELWRADEGDLSHEAYLAWWRENGGEDEGYSIAHHAEKHMTMLGRPGMLPGLTLAQVCDRLLSRFGPLLAAEGFRRWLTGHADRAAVNDP